MFQLRRILQTIAFVLFATMLASFALSEDKPAPKTTPAATPVNIDVEFEAKNDVQKFYVIYYSTETHVDAQAAAQGRLYASNEALLLAQKKLNGHKSSGMRNIARGAGFNDLVKQLPGGSTEASRLLPMIQDGWHVLFIMDPDETEWSAPYVLNPYINKYEQIKFARRDDKNSNPRRYLAAPPPPSSPAPPPAPSPPAGAPKPK